MAVADLAGVEGIGGENAEALVQGGFLTIEGILAADLEDLDGIEGIGPGQAQAVRDAAEAAYERVHGTIEA